MESLIDVTRQAARNAAEDVRQRLTAWRLPESLGVRFPCCYPNLQFHATPCLNLMIQFFSSSLSQTLSFTPIPVIVKSLVFTQHHQTLSPSHHSLYVYCCTSRQQRNNSSQ